MTTIDKLDISIYVQYARRQESVEGTQQQFRFEEAASIPAQIQVVDLYPKMTEVDLLLGVIPVQSPWASFVAPPKYRFQRRSAFGFFRVAPSLGSFEKEEDDERKLDLFEESDEQQKEEKKTLQLCFQQIKKINNWLSFIVGRVGQFLQG